MDSKSERQKSKRATGAQKGHPGKTLELSTQPDEILILPITGPKLDEYTRLPSLERYVMVEQDRRVVRIYRRTPQGWLFESLENEGEIEVPCLETKLTLDQVFAGIEFEARETEIASQPVS